MIEGPLERRLAAILAADVVGYSRMTGTDEEGAIRRLKQYRESIVDPAVENHHGRIIKTIGDGLLIEFTSIVEGVVCSLEIQRQSVAHNEKLKSNNRIMLRIGLHLGDVMVQPDGDLLGDGVNIAARLEAIADPGGVCLSEDAYRQVRDRVSENFTDLGELELKNIVRPVRVYSLSLNSREQKTRKARTKKRSSNSTHEKPQYIKLPQEIRVRGPGFSARLRTVRDAVRLIDRDLSPEFASQPRWTFARALLAEAANTGKLRDLRTAARQLTQALLNDRWLEED